jgi:hypothetical protein
MADLFTLTTVLPATIGASALGLGVIWRQSLERRRKAVRLAQDAAVLTLLKDGSALLVQEKPPERKKGTDNEEVKLDGTRMVVGVGTVGSKRLLDMLVTHDRDGVTDDIGSILFYECASGTRREIMASLPETYKDRAIFSYSHTHPDGLGNDTPEEVEADVVRWGVSLLEGIEEVIRLHEERNKRKPAEVLLFLSLGGHAYPGVFAALELHQRLPLVPIFAVVNLPDQEDQREYFLRLKDSYEKVGVTGWLIGDMMEGDYVKQDNVLGHLFAGFTASSVYSDTSTRFNNIAMGVTNKGKGGIARFEFCYGEVVAYPFQPDPEEPPIYYVLRDQVINEAQRLISVIEEQHAEVSIDAPVGVERRQTYDLVLFALHPNDVLGLRDHIEQARRIEDKQLEKEERPHLHPQGNYRSVYSYWVRGVNPEHPRCKIAVIRLRSLRDVPQHLEELVKFPRKRSYTEGRPIFVDIVATNGYSDDEDFE